MTPQELWEKSRSPLEHALSPRLYSFWFGTTELTEIREVGEDRAIGVISGSSVFHLSNVENKYYAHIKEVFDKLTGKKFELQFAIKQGIKKQKDLSGKAGKSSSKKNPQEEFPNLFSQEDQRTEGSQEKGKTFPTSFTFALQKAGLREDYTFETLAVSSSNEMAHAAAVAVSQNPGTAYNPLFLYGGVGVGKTHLMQAIGNNILRKNPQTPIAYITGEQFTNEIVAAIQQKRTIDLKKKFRNYKVLLVDDVQFIAGKNTVQEEFFHTFNAITPAGGQIILTSDRPPHEIMLLEDRLRSRFEAGLIVDIQQPSFELRTAILLIKAKKLELDLPMDVAQRIASAIESTRRLEGILIKLHSEHALFKKPISIELAEEILGKIEKVEFPKQDIKPAEVLKTVAAQFHLTTNSLKGPSRVKNLVEARHIAMYILRYDLGVTLDQIGLLFNGRDHSSIIHATEKIKATIIENEELRTRVNAVKTSLSFRQES